MDKIKIAKKLIGMVRELVAGEDGLTLEQIQEKASKVIEHLVSTYNLVDSDTNMGSRDGMTEEESYEDGYVPYTLWDKTWEKETNDMLNIEMWFWKNGKIDVYAHTFGNGIEVHEGSKGLDENGVYTTVGKILQDWRKELPAIYKKK